MTNTSGRLARLGKKACAALNGQGEPCQQAPMTDLDHCFWHSPEHERDAQEARRLGGRRRRREHVITGSFDLEGLDTPVKIRRLLEVVAADVLELENSIARARALIYLAATASRLFETSELEERIQALESELGRRKAA